MGKPKKKPQGKAVVAAPVVRGKQPKRINLPKERVFKRGVKGAGLDGTKTHFRRSGLSRKEFAARFL